MTGVQGVSASVSFSSTSAALPTAAGQASAAQTGAAAVAGDPASQAIPGVSPSLSQQVTSLLSFSNQQPSQVDEMVALLVALLLAKNSKSQDNNSADPLATLAGMALLGAALQSGQSSFSFSQQITNIGDASGSYAAQNTTVSSGMSVNFQA